MAMGKAHREISECPVACTLDIFGDRWSLLVIRGLMFFGEHEFKEFLAMEEGIATNILASRLKHLQKRGILKCTVHPGNKTRKLYYLTEQGKELIHILVPLVIWAQKHEKDAVRIPVKERKLLKTPQIFIDDTLGRLRSWETEHLPSAVGEPRRGRI